MLKLAPKLKARQKQKRYTDRSLAVFEKEIFFAFYAIRKLIESEKLSDSVANLSVPAFSYPRKGKPEPFRSWRYKLDALYDFQKRKPVPLNLGFVCNQIIHSYIYIEGFDDDGKLDGIFFSSDRERKRKLYYLELSAIVNLLKRVGSNYPRKWSGYFDEKKGDYVHAQE